MGKIEAASAAPRLDRLQEVHERRTSRSELLLAADFLDGAAKDCDDALPLFGFSHQPSFVGKPPTTKSVVAGGALTISKPDKDGIEARSAAG